MLHDGVNQVWVLRFRGGLDVDGFESDRQLVTALLLRNIDWSNPWKHLDVIRSIAEDAEAKLREMIEEEAAREQQQEG